MAEINSETEQLAGYRRALHAEPRLQAVVATVDALCALVRRTDRLCHGCAWETIVKPLVTPLLGWARGYAPNVADDPSPETAGLKLVDLAELLATQDERRVPATTATERWLRTSEAYDAFTDVLLDRLERADPANGHGIGRAERTGPATSR